MNSRKKIIEQYRERPNQCPWCHSRKVKSVGDLINNKQPMHCNNCGQNWDAIRGISGIAFDGFSFEWGNEGDQRTLELSWFELHKPDFRLICPNCGEDFKFLYCLDTSPESASENADALCWDCAGVHFHFPLNQVISLPRVIL